MIKRKISEMYNPEIKKNILIDGLALKSALEGQEVKIATKGTITSYDNDFQHLFDNLLSAFVPPPELHDLNRLLVHIKQDNCAYIYRQFPLVFKTILSVPKKKGQVVFKNELTDIESVIFEDDFSYFDYKTEDKIIYLFRARWNFGLYFDFRKKSKLEIILKEIGHLHKLVNYYEMFSFLNNSDFFNTFTDDGWFPFIALIQFNHFHKLMHYYATNKENIADLEILKSSISGDLLNQIMQSWWNNPILNQKKEILKAGINSYLEHNSSGYIKSIKTLVSEIEGILRFSFSSDVKGRKIRPFLEELAKRGISRYSSNNALTFPIEFISYLKDSIFAQFDFDGKEIPPSRHAFDHGVAEVEKYSWTRALQLILTIDHIRFFL